MDEGIVEHLQSALTTWNEKFSEILTLLTTSPKDFQGGAAWSVISNINTALQGIGLGLLVIFFAMGVVQTTASIAEMKNPVKAVKLLVRFALTKVVVVDCMELLNIFMTIGQGTISTILGTVGTGSGSAAVLPAEIITAVQNCGFWTQLGLWLVTLLGSLIITVLAFVMILTVYGRFFKLYMYTAISPIPLASFAGESTGSMGKTFLKSYAGVALEGAVIALACVIFNSLASTTYTVDPTAAASSMVWDYLEHTIFNMLVLTSMVKMSDRVVRDLTGV